MRKWFMRFLFLLALPLLPFGASAAQEIGTVWNLVQRTCGPTGNEMKPHPDADMIRASHKVQFAALKQPLDVPIHPDFGKESVKLHIGDRLRGVIDDYLLVSDGDYAEYSGAIVVTHLPSAMDTREKIFERVRQLQGDLSRRNRVPVMVSTMFGRFGDGLEMIVPGRLAGYCFPTAEFQMAPAAPFRTVGISRFAVIDRRLVEYAMVLKWTGPDDETAMRRYARDAMDRFWDPSISPASARLP